MIELSLYISSEGIFQARLWWWQGEFRSKWVLGQTLELWEKCQKPSTLRRFWGFSGDDQERSVHHEICRQSTVAQKYQKCLIFSILDKKKDKNKYTFKILNFRAQNGLKTLIYVKWDILTDFQT